MTVAVALLLGGCAAAGPRVHTKTIVVYDNAEVGGNTAIWKPEGIPVAGFRYANVFVEFQQKDPSEEPLSVGIGFAPWRSGRAGTRNYYNLENDQWLGAELPEQGRGRKPAWISGGGRDTWHGDQGISSYAVRVPVLGPFMWVYPLNQHSEARHFTVAVYLTE